MQLKKQSIFGYSNELLVVSNNNWHFSLINASYKEYILILPKVSFSITVTLFLVCGNQLFGSWSQEFSKQGMHVSLVHHGICLHIRICQVGLVWCVC